MTTIRNTQLQGIYVYTCSNDSDATSSEWRVDSVGIPDKIDVWRNAVGMDAISPCLPSRPSSTPCLYQPPPRDIARRQWVPTTPIPTHGASAINASAINAPHSQKCIACACDDECCGWWLHALPNAVPGMNGLWTRPRSRNRVIPLQSTRLHNHSLLSFYFSVMHLPRQGSDAARKASGLQRALRGELRTLDQRPNSPSLYAPSLLFFSSYPFCAPPRPRYSGHSLSSISSSSLVCLVFEGTFAKQKAFHRGTPSPGSGY